LAVCTLFNSQNACDTDISPYIPHGARLTAGTFLVFAQFLYVTIQTLPTQLYYPPGARLPRWRKNEVPMRRWIVQVVLFFTINISGCSGLTLLTGSEQLRVRAQGMQRELIELRVRS